MNLINQKSCCQAITNIRGMGDEKQKMKFSNKNFFSKCDQIRTFLRIWSHLLKKS